jgi:hypothetical protein
MQQRTWRMAAAAVLLTSLAAPMALSAQTPASTPQFQIMMGPAAADSTKTKADSAKPVDSAKTAPSKGQVITLQAGKPGQVISIPMSALNFSFGPATPAPKDSTKKAGARDCAAPAGSADSASKQNDGGQAGAAMSMGMGTGSCDQKSDSTATPGR